MATLVLTSCAVFRPRPITPPDDFDHVQTQATGDVRASVAILSDEQAEEHFGVDLARRGIQVLWLRIRNATESTLWLVRNIIDPDDYPPDEAARMVRGNLGDEEFERLSQYFRDESMRIMLPPRTEADGFLFLPQTRSSSPSAIPRPGGRSARTGRTRAPTRVGCWPAVGARRSASSR